MEEDIKILEERINYFKENPEGCNWTISFEESELIHLENILKRYKELEEENKELKKQLEEKDMQHELELIGKEEYTKSEMGEIIKELDQAMTYMLQDLEVEKKGWTIEEMKRAYLSRAKSNGIFIK